MRYPAAGELCVAYISVVVPKEKKKVNRQVTKPPFATSFSLPSEAIF